MLGCPEGIRPWLACQKEGPKAGGDGWPRQQDGPGAGWVGKLAEAKYLGRSVGGGETAGAADRMKKAARESLSGFTASDPKAQVNLGASGEEPEARGGSTTI